MTKHFKLLFAQLGGYCLEFSAFSTTKVSVKEHIWPTVDPLNRASVEILKQCCGLNPLLFYGCEEQEQVKDDADISLLPTIVERVVLPKLTVISENIWDPFSTTQTCRVVAIVQKPVGGYPSVVNAENKNTQMLLKALLLRMRRTLDADVFMPFYPKNILENKNSGPYLFFQRQFWSSGKLLGNFLQWYGILSNKTPGAVHRWAAEQAHPYGFSKLRVWRGQHEEGSKWSTSSRS
ncbi:PAX3- and PAX7-binding protein 1-like [Pithys albifrons albifrons]|uniref:PAX3- and PAX7-binding protein 1-like n=1 Tax=Pithys albifrons albifrons TaxID=3385563 RepID=UPI003A5CCF4B